MYFYAAFCNLKVRQILVNNSELFTSNKHIHSTKPTNKNLFNTLNDGLVTYNFLST